MTNEDNTWATAVLAQIEQKLERVAAATGSKIPYTTTADGRFDDHSQMTGDSEDPSSISWWTNGFYPGILWWMYARTHQSLFKTNAVAIENKLAQSLTLFNGLHHDVGFMFMPSSVRHYQLTGNLTARTRGLHAATILAGRFNLAGRFIRAWNDGDQELDRRGWTIIDSMMNIQLLYWASETSGDPRFKQIAIAHANTVQQYFIRPDHSVKHIVEFDPTTGKYLRSYGGQGLRHGSAWSRGQAWAVYGFAYSYAQTHDPHYRAAAEHVADYFIAHVPASFVVPIDFDQPAKPALEDASAATIFASGLLLLAQQTHNQHYYQYAVALLKFLVNQRLDLSSDRDNLVTHASASYHEDHHEYAIIYADYYLIEALLRLEQFTYNEED